MAQVEISKSELQEIMTAAITASKQAPAMNPLEQRKFDDEDAKDRRRDLLGAELAKVEMEKRWRDQNACSHSVDRQTGDAVPRGTGKWITGGQAYQDGTAALHCLRCKFVWRFRPTPEQFAVIVQNGMYAFAPPPDEQTLCNGCLEPKPKCKCEAEYKKQRYGTVTA